MILWHFSKQRSLTARSRSRLLKQVIAWLTKQTNTCMQMDEVPINYQIILVLLWLTQNMYCLLDTTRKAFGPSGPRSLDATFSSTMDKSYCIKCIVFKKQVLVITQRVIDFENSQENLHG